MYWFQILNNTILHYLTLKKKCSNECRHQKSLSHPFPVSVVYHFFFYLICFRDSYYIVEVIVFLAFSYERIIIVTFKNIFFFFILIYFFIKCLLWVILVLVSKITLKSANLHWGVSANFYNNKEFQFMVFYLKNSCWMTDIYFA